MADEILRSRKLRLSLTVSLCGEQSRGTLAFITHNNELSTPLADLIKSSLASAVNVDPATHFLLLPVPVRPMIHSVQGAPPIIPSKFSKCTEDDAKPLPAPHASLPMKPAWAALPEAETQSFSATVPLEAKPPSKSPKVPARRVWHIPCDASTTLENALRGTAILEWPVIEVWSNEKAEKSIRDGTLELAERREFDPDRGRKRKFADGEGSDGNTQDRSHPKITAMEHDPDSDSEEVEDGKVLHSGED